MTGILRREFTNSLSNLSTANPPADFCAGIISTFIRGHPACKWTKPFAAPTWQPTDSNESNLSSPTWNQPKPGNNTVQVFVSVQPTPRWWLRSLLWRHRFSLSLILIGTNLWLVQAVDSFSRCQQSFVNSTVRCKFIGSAPPSLSGGFISFSRSLSISSQISTVIRIPLSTRRAVIHLPKTPVRGASPGTDQYFAPKVTRNEMAIYPVATRWIIEVGSSRNGYWVSMGPLFQFLVGWLERDEGENNRCR
ncbi:hypothetical protein DL96DRAFT_624707 [Flagelloscypha sp. PMI_526]|nr:hypothetical protein DL96DRAFT_624707 [Flagelloscypha sp. PMI_526]